MTFLNCYIILANRGKAVKGKFYSCNTTINTKEGFCVTMKALPPDERRKNPRIDFHLKVLIRGQRGLKEIRNFGLYGVFIRTDNPSQFKRGDEIYVAMKLPGEKKAMYVKAKIVHIIKKGIGVEFIDVPPKDAMIMEYCFNIFKDTVPLPGT